MATRGSKTHFDNPKKQGIIKKEEKEKMINLNRDFYRINKFFYDEKYLVLGPQE